MPSNPPGIVLSLAALCGVGCLTNPFVRIDRPVEIRGVVVALVDQTCRDHSDSKPPYSDLLDLRLTIRGRNTGLANATFDLAGIRLIADGMTLTPHESTGAAIIRPGSSRDLDVHFVGSGALACDKPMAIALNDALEVGSSGRSTHEIAFLAGNLNR